jgi:hypothetical protein
LFAGFLSAFLIELLGRLEQDPLDIIQDVLVYQTQMMRNSSLGPYVPADFSPPEHIVVVNALFYASLGVIILAAFIAMLIKSWVREFDRGLRAMSIPEQRAKTREFRYLGMEYWKLPEMVGILPFLIQISLLLFAIGLVIFLFHISKPSCGVTTTIFGVGIFYYAMTTSISVVVTSSPFHSPLSRRLSKVYQRLHAHFCPVVGSLLSEAMDTTPVTTLGRVNRHIQIFLQKSRPYLENNFVEPILATSMDSVQLSTAASALQRIYESAPNSQHSEALHWSVWQVAGSATHCIPPLFNQPTWIFNKGDDEEYFSDVPTSMLVALVAVWLRTPHKFSFRHIFTICAVLRREENTTGPWVQLVTAVFDRVVISTYGNVPFFIEPEVQTEASDITRMIQRKELHREESLWLLRTLAELCSEGRLSWGGPYLIDICLATLLFQVPELSYMNHSDLILFEAVVTLAAISCSPDDANRQNIITSSRKHPWRLLNIRNPSLFGTWFEDTPSNCHKSLISILFLVVYALICRGSYPLAVQYFGIIMAKDDLPFHASALTTVAPAMDKTSLSAIGRMLVARTRDLTPIIGDFMSPKGFYGQGRAHEKLLEDYDHRIGASENPDPHFLAILLVLSNSLEPSAIQRLQSLNLELKNPHLRLAARVIARLDIPDGPDVSMVLFSDHRVQNMIAALSLLQYRRRWIARYTELLLLASFLQSREPAISSAALEYYMKTAIFYSDPPAPSNYLSHAVHAVFNVMVPDHQLWMGWGSLETFVNGFEMLPVEWRRTFAEGFFTLSRQPLSQFQGDTKTNTLESELENILTWRYFHKEEQESEFTDSEFSGLDWMAIAWSLHLSQQSERRTEGLDRGDAQSWDMDIPAVGAQSWVMGVTAVDEEFVLRALCKLLDAAPYYQIIPIIPKLCEFIQWFDDTDLAEYRHLISSRVKEVVRRNEESRVLHKFDKFHCMWYI